MPKKDAKLSFEDGLARIKEITALLENKDCTLEQSIRLYREGMAISEQCRRELEAAGARIENVEYGTDVTLDLLLPAGTEESAARRLADLSAGTVELLELGQEYRAVKLVL